MYIFLDTNVYLSFYHFGKDDLETMHKVAKLIEDGELGVYSNSHLKDEIERNRHNKISDGFKILSSTKYGREFPVYCKSYEKYEILIGKLKEINKIHRELIEDIENDIRNRALEADKLIARILDASTEIEINDEIFHNARYRVDLGNPPGKARSLGDAIHWECLLKTDSQGLWIVSRDGDFSSPLYSGEIDPFLESEWKRTKEKKWAEVTLFETLSHFLSAKFPKFELSIEAKKDELIEQLNQSGSFARTHEIVGQLLDFSSFTAGQAMRLCKVLTENNQIYRIAEDDDIQELFKIVKKNSWFLSDDDTLKEAATLLGWPEYELTIPF